MGRAATLVLRTGLGLALVFPGCGEGKKTRTYFPPADAIEAVDGVEPDVPPTEVPVCTIQKPMANRILTGVAEVRVVVSDPKQEVISRVVFAFLATGQSPVKVGEVTSVPQDGVLTLVVDSAKVQDGQYTFFCQVEAADGRKGSAGVPVRVDNTPPKVELYPPSTPPYSNFLSNLVVRVSVSDGNGIGTEHLIIRVNGDAVADLMNPVPGLQKAVVVEPHDLLVGKNTVEITASDKNGNVTPSPLSYWVNFVPPATFLSADQWALPKDLAIERVSGIETATGHGVLAWGSRGAYLLMPGPQATLSVAASPVTTAVSLARVADLNGDGLEDILLVTAETGDRSTVQFFPQSTTGTFPATASWKGTLDGPANDLAFGDLNRDDRPDLVLSLATASASVAVALSKPSGAAGIWSGFSTYGGVEEPYLVAVGDYTADGDNDVMVTRRSSSVVTVFPVNGETGMLLVGINSDLKYKPGTGTSTPLTALTSLMPGPPVAGGKGDTIVVADGNLNFLFQVAPDPGTGPGSLAVSAAYPTGLTPSRVVGSDADGDGRSDLVTWCPGSAMVLVEWGNDKGGFDEGPAFLASREASDLTLAPLTGGPRPDIVILDQTNQRLHVLAAVQASFRRFSGASVVRLGFVPRAIAAGRYVKALPALPSHKDLALLGADGTGDAWVHILAASEETGLPTQKAEPVKGFVHNPTDLLTADLDKNGYDDLLIPSQAVSAAGTTEPTMGRLLFEPGASHVFASLKAGIDPVTGADLRFGTWAGDSPTLAVIADLKRESSKPGVLDLAVIAKFRATPDSDPVPLFQPFVGQGDGTFRIQEGVLYPVDATQGPSALAAARLTGGSNYDVVMTQAKSGEFSIFFAKGLGLFKAGEGEAEEFAVGTNPQRVAIETLDAPVGSLDDPYPDLVILLEADVAIVRATAKVGDEVQYAPPVGLGHVGRGPVDLAVHDVNGDGYADIVVLDQQDAMVTIYLNLAQGRFSDPFRYLVGVSPVRMTVADFDADSCPDIATADGTGQSVTILRNLTCDKQ